MWCFKMSYLLIYQPGVCSYESVRRFFVNENNIVPFLKDFLEGEVLNTRTGVTLEGMELDKDISPRDGISYLLTYAYDVRLLDRLPDFKLFEFEFEDEPCELKPVHHKYRT